MSVFHDRIISQGGGGPDYHPYGTGDTVLSWPAFQVTYAQDGALYGTVHPLVTADGAVVPAYADVSYPDVVPAGRP